ncbi:MAG TPA: hypothetical protein DDZ41_03385, partial [Flavobacterium sp.]|nr:hypothetical protein [Flavobacterium sp.]
MSGKHEEGSENWETNFPSQSNISQIPETRNSGGGSQHRSRILSSIEEVTSQKSNYFNLNLNKFTDNRKTYVSKSTQCNNSKFRLRNRKYFDLKRRIKKIVSSSVINDQAGDNRLYAKVVIAGQEIRGLLDSGASITVLGSGSEEFLSKLGVHFYHNPSSLSTASGEKQRIFGHIKCFVLYGDKKHMMRIFIAPGLKQKLYLGIDFWKLFGLEPKL